MKLKNETENTILASSNSNNEPLSQIKMHSRLLHKIERKKRNKET